MKLKEAQYAPAIKVISCEARGNSYLGYPPLKNPRYKTVVPHPHPLPPPPLATGPPLIIYFNFLDYQRILVLLSFPFFMTFTYFSAIYPGGHSFLERSNYTRVGKQILELAMKVKFQNQMN